MKYYLLAPIALITMAAHSQTTVILRITPKTILLATDTKIRAYSYTSILNIKRKTVNMDTMQKIGGSNGVYFGLSGQAISYFYSAAQRSCDSAYSFINAVNKFIKAGSEILPKIAIQVRKQFPIDYESDYKNKEAIGVIFCGQEHDTTKFCFVALRVNDDDTSLYISSRTIIYPSDDFPEIAHYGFGHTSAITLDVISEKEWQPDEIKTAVRLIKKQAKATPDFVAPPVDILTIRKGKAVLKRYN